MNTERQLCSFRLGDLLLGLPVSCVQEVLRFQQMTRVPMACGAIAGLINLRGQIVTAVDLRQRFGLPARPAAAEPMNVVVRTADGIVSLLVDEIGDVLLVDDGSYEAPPATLRQPARSLIRGVHKLDARRLLLLLELDRVLAIDATAHEQAARRAGQPLGAG
ncbi:MAG: chemotaxis protein CheW [Planctomycetes bacterium]|nr:chemotaxis protein CheW [Planctomycetota bacterium]